LREAHISLGESGKARGAEKQKTSTRRKIRTRSTRRRFAPPISWRQRLRVTGARSAPFVCFASFPSFVLKSDLADRTLREILGVARSIRKCA
jgi:hypothetical protein